MTTYNRWTSGMALALCMLVTASASADGDLKKAYKREFAFLAAEKGNLTKRVTELAAERTSKVGQARSEIDQLQGSIMRSSLEADRLENLLMEAERAATGSEENAEVVDRTLEQVNAQLEKLDVKMPELEGEGQEASAKQLLAAFDLAVQKLGDSGRVTKSPGEFFDLGGKRVEGEVVHIGWVARYGVGGEAAGMLAPAGEGRLKLWPKGDTAPVARALAQGNAPKRLPVFLFESLKHGAEQKKGKTALQVIKSGGAIAWVIVGLGCISLLMMLLRALLLMRSAANTEKLVTTITPLLEQGLHDRAIELCRKSRSAAGRVLRVTLQNLERERDHLEDIISESILHETPGLDRFGSAILVMAAVAPLLGLLGTVTGMISTFDVITEFGTGNPKLLSGGISEALVTTELGLIVAIPSLLGGNLLSGWAEGIKDDMDRSALRVTNIGSGIRVNRMLRESEAPASLPPTPAKATGA